MSRAVRPCCFCGNTSSRIIRAIIPSHCSRPPTPNASGVNGLNALDTNKVASYIIKTNLSKETVPGVESIDGFQARELPGGDQIVYYATVNDQLTFLELLWEGSILGGNGYYLGVTTNQAEKSAVHLVQQ